MTKARYQYSTTFFDKDSSRKIFRKFRKNKLLIYGPSILHPIKPISSRFIKENSDKNYQDIDFKGFDDLTNTLTDRIINAAVRNIFPNIKTQIEKYADMHVFFLPQHYVYRTPASNMQMHITAIEQYNEKLQKSIFKHLNHPRVIWLDVVKKITMSPGGALLVPDGTHLNWAANKQIHEKMIPSSLSLVVTHRAIIDVVMNTVCRKYVVQDLGTNLCCK